MFEKAQLLDLQQACGTRVRKACLASNVLTARFVVYGIASSACSLTIRCKHRFYAKISL